MPKANTPKRKTARRGSKPAPEPQTIIIEKTAVCDRVHYVPPPDGKRLATNPQEWAETDALVREHVERICGRYDDREQAESFYILLDLITNERYDRIDRDGVLHVVQTHAFTFTDAFETAQKVCLGQAPQGTELRMVM